MTFEEWERTAPPALTKDRAWKMRVYRLATYLTEVGRMDARKLILDPLGRAAARQLFRAIGSVRANVVEGYSRSSGRERARFFEYALGSARESREWYSHVGPLLPSEILEARLDLIAEIVRMLLAIIPRERGRTLRPPRWMQTET
jgi:four helix bundle protein